MLAELAQPSDDIALRDMLRRIPVGGQIQVGFEREPDYFRAVRTGSSEAYTVIVRDPGRDRIACVGDISVRNVFVEGKPLRAAYMSNWRVDPAWRGHPEFLESGLQLVSDLQRDEIRADIFYSAIVADNIPALRRLETRRSGLARFNRVDDLVTFLLPTRPATTDLKKSRIGSPEDQAKMEVFRSKTLLRFPFASDWRTPELSGNGIPSDDEFLVLRKGGDIVGCGAIWDQRAYRQMILRGYSFPLRLLRPVHNAAVRFTGSPSLPPIGAPLELASIAGFAVRQNDPALAVELLDVLRRSGCRERGISVIALTLSTRHPAVPTIKRRFRPWSYRSRLYQVSMPGVELNGSICADHPAQPEAALL